MGSGDHYAVYNNKGNEFFRAEHGDGIAEFTITGENLLRADVPGGNMLLLTRFFDVEKSLYSPMYNNVLGFGHGKVVYMTWREKANSKSFDLLIVHDMFDPELNRNSIQRDFAAGMALPIEVEPDQYTWRSVQTAEFTDESTLFVTYYNNQRELVEETLKLK